MGEVHKPKSQKVMNDKVRRKSGRINWAEVKKEFLASDEPLTAILSKYKISTGRNVTKKTQGWIQEREELYQKAIEKIKHKIVNKTAKEWDNQIKLWKAVESEAAKILQKSLKGEEQLNPRDLANLTASIERALKSQKLIKGEATDVSEQRNIHLDLVDLVEKVEKDGENGNG